MAARKDERTPDALSSVPGKSDASARALKREAVKLKRLKLRLLWWEDRQPGGHQLKVVQEQIAACQNRIAQLENPQPPPVVPPDTVEGRILKLLSDGQPRTKDELHCCLWDDLSSKDAVRVFVHRLRMALHARGDDIILERSALGIRYKLALGHLLPIGTG